MQLAIVCCYLFKVMMQKVNCPVRFFFKIRIIIQKKIKILRITVMKKCPA